MHVFDTGLSDCTLAVSWCQQSNIDAKGLIEAVPAIIVNCGMATK
jgi:hypothetical protein